MGLPPAGIGDKDERTAPTGRRNGPLDIGFDTSQESHDDERPKAHERPPQSRLARETQCRAPLCVRAVDRSAAQVHQVAARVAEPSEEVVRVDRRRKGDEKRSTDGAIESRIGAIEERARGGRRFADEENAHSCRFERSAQRFALARTEHPPGPSGRPRSRNRHRPTVQRTFDLLLSSVGPATDCNVFCDRGLLGSRPVEETA
jgi:hypothetical protein